MDCGLYFARAHGLFYKMAGTRPIWTVRPAEGSQRRGHSPWPAFVAAFVWQRLVSTTEHDICLLSSKGTWISSGSIPSMSSNSMHSVPWLVSAQQLSIQLRQLIISHIFGLSAGSTCMHLPAKWRHVATCLYPNCASFAVLFHRCFHLLCTFHYLLTDKCELELYEPARYLLVHLKVCPFCSLL